MSHSYIKSKNSFEGAYEIFNNMGYDIVTYFISLLLFFTFLYYAKVFADFAASKINNIEQADAIAEKTA
jgi:uncharacterized membrane protein YesL